MAAHEITLVEMPPSGVRVSHTFTFPSSWDEVDGAGLLAITRAQAAAQEDTHVRWHLLRELAGIPACLMELMPPAEDLMYLPGTNEEIETEVPMHTLIPQLDWAFTPPVWHESRLPHIEHDGTKWVGPDDDLQTMPMAQWIYTSNTLANFRQAKDNATAMEAVDTFMACLYIPDGTTWNHHVDANKPRLASLPPEVKLAAVLNYEALHATLPKSYWRVFTPKGNEGPPSPMGLFGMAYEVARSGVFGPHKDVEMEKLHTVLAYMEHSLFTEEENEKKFKAAGKK